MKKLLNVFISLLFIQSTYGQSAEIGANYLVLPKLTTNQRNILTPKSGQLLFNNTSNQFELFDGINWKTLDLIDSNKAHSQIIKSNNNLNSTGLYIGLKEDFNLPGNNNSENTIIGIGAGGRLVSAPNTSTTGYANSYNTFLGSQAGYNLRANEYTASGMQATTNTIIGSYAAQYAGNNSIANTFIGFGTARFASASDHFGKLEANVAIGGNAMVHAKKALYNIIIGDNTFNGSQSIMNNVVIGTNSGATFNSGDDNVFLGSYIAGGTSSGTGNIVIGTYGASNLQGDKNVLIGYKVSSSAANFSNRLYIANSNKPNPLIYGEFDNKIVKINGKIIASNISFGDTTSSVNSATTSPEMGPTYLTLPRLSSIIRDNNEGQKGNIIYNTTSNNVEYFDGVVWKNLINNPSNLLSISGNGNLSVGGTSFNSTTSGYSNYALSENSFQTNTTGSRNIAIGKNVLSLNTVGNNNTAVGYDAMKFNTTGTENSAFGIQALNKITGGERNNAFGNGTMNENTGGNDNAAFGSGALNQNNLGHQNTAVGNSALEKNVNNNGLVAIGFQAMQYADNRSSGIMAANTAVGFEALRGSISPANNTGVNNTAVGSKALSSNTSGTSNVAIGSSAMIGNTTGNDNTSVGISSLYSNVNGATNVSIGNGSLEKNTTGSSNTGVGFQALYLNTTGGGNIALGMNAGGNNTTGLNNIFIGNSSNPSTGNLSNSIAIGNGSTIDPSNAMAFGNNSVTKWVFGRSNTSEAGYALQVGSSTSNGNGAFLTNGGTWTNASSRAFKENFEDLSNAEILSKVAQLNVQKWKYKGTDETHIGPIAEEFKELFELGVKGDKEHISTIDASGVALKAIQALMEEIEIRDKQLKELNLKFEKLEMQLNILTEKIKL